MERRELYDPEDIEQLLIERAYDDLLEEERAFVLRHLSDRSEYERMRALLLRMHTDEEDAVVPSADPSVRTHVLDVFRAQQQPQWRIWLNGVSTLFIPRERVNLWRPALAFGSLALVITLAIVGSRSLDQTSAPEMAEVKQTTPAPPPPEVTVRTQKANDPTTTAAKEETGALEEAQGSIKALDYTVDDARKPEAFSLAEAAEQPAPMEPAAAFKDEVASLDEEAATPAKMVPTPGAFLFDMGDTVRSTVDGIDAHVVTRNELTMNATTASGATARTITQVNADLFAQQESLKKKESKRKRSEREADAQSAEDASALVGLLRAAW